MSQSDLSRRDFNRLSMAALGGALSGAFLASCTPQTSESGDDGGNGAAAAKHVCRGLNDCKGQGTSGGNACRGQGKCATAKAHSCKGMNECKGQGGCGENPGQNDCKGNGACAVPLGDDAWKKARTALEAKWKAAGQSFGSAPAA